MRNPFRREPPRPVFDPFEVAEAVAEVEGKIQEMGLAEKRLDDATRRANAATKEARQARADLDQSIAGARRQIRGAGGRTW